MLEASEQGSLAPLVRGVLCVFLNAGTMSIAAQRITVLMFKQAFGLTLPWFQADLLLLLFCIAGGPAAVRQLLALLQLLGVPPLSKCITSEVSYEELASWDEMAARVADALLMAQRWAWHSRSRQQYDDIAGG
jgi:hypothetical protein